MATQPSFSLHLLGPFNLQAADGRRIQDLRRKTRAILAYLAVASRPYSRSELADLFNPEAQDPRRTLRLSISRLRGILGPTILLSSGETVQLNFEEIWIDVRQFGQTFTNRDTSQWSTVALEQASHLYEGEFLAGLHLPDAPEFEMWLLGQRSHWQHLYERGVLSLLDRYLEETQFDQALPLAQQLVERNPLLEEAHYRLVWLYAQTGRRTAALAQYEQCRQYLANELAVEPMPALAALQANILAGHLGEAPILRLARPAAPTWPVTANFVGRQEELAQLEAVWADVQAGNGRIALMTAEAGGGKTRLAQEFAAMLPQTVYLAGQCYESTHSLAYHPWRQPLEKLLGQVGQSWQTLPAIWLDELARLLPAVAARRPVTPATSQPEQLFAGVAALLRLSARPLLLFLDDIQWADAASLQLLSYLAERAAMPLLLLVAYRSEEAEDNSALLTLLREWSRRGSLHLALPPLSPGAIEQLLTQLWAQLPTGYRAPHLRDRLHQATGGNPLFIGEIVRELSSVTHPPDELPVPPSLRELIHRRLRQLPGSGRQVLESLAILEQPSSFDLARQISARSEEESLQALELGLRWRLLRSDAASQQVAFSHDLMRQAVAEQLTPVRRQLLHRRTAVALCQQPGVKAATLVYHWRLAGDAMQEGIYAAQAGEEAAALYAHEEAIRYLELALSLLPKPAERLRILLLSGRIYQVTSQWEQAEITYRQALELAVTINNRRAVAECQAAYGRLLRLKGEYGQALAWLQQAAAEFTTLNDHQGLNTAYGGLGAIYWSQLDYPQALTYFEKQLQNARQHQNQSGESAALGSMGVVYTEMGHYSQAWRCYQQQLQIDMARQDRLGLSRGVGNMGTMYAAQGQYAAALACYQYLLQMGLELGDRLMVGVAVGNMGDVYLAQGQHQLAERLCQQAIRLTEKLNLPLYLCEYLSVHARLCLAQQDVDMAQTLNNQALQIAREANRKDILLMAQVFAVQLPVWSNKAPPATAVTALQTMLSHWPEDAEQAAIEAAIWQLDPTQTAHRQHAVALYRALHQHSPNVEYRQQYAALTGETLPEPPPLPEPPSLVANVKNDLDALLAQVDELLR